MSGILQAYFRHVMPVHQWLYGDSPGTPVATILLSAHLSAAV